MLLAVTVLTGCSSQSVAPAVSTAHGPAPEAGHGMTLTRTGAGETFPGPEARTVRGALAAMFTAYEQKDLARWLGAWTDEGFQQAFGVTKAEGGLVPPSWGDVRSFRESSVEVIGTVEHGDHVSGRDVHTAELPAQHGVGEHAVIDTIEAGIVTRQRLDLRWEQERWRIAARVPLPASSPEQVVEARLAEHRIDLSRATVGRSFVLRVANQGRLSHELLLLRDRGGQDETVGRISAQPSGQTWDLVARDLPPGEYALVCNLLDELGRPHSALGMRTGLTVG